jgi:UDP-galactopyranose mutase
MDQLSAFRGAPPELVQLERELLGRADVVFTGGHSLFEAKRDMHHNVHAFPSSVDVAHFAKGRILQVEPADQTKIGRPRLGFAGVIDERFDIPLVDAVSKARPDWQLVLLGPVVKIDPTTLPQRANLHYLGSKSYDSLPAYLSGWDVAIMPFARNESTRYISPTKTPEYLAAGRRVVSTSITDVVRPYGEQNLVAIADQPDEFIAAVEAALGSADDAGDWAKRRDALLSTLSWDKTFYAMWKKVEQALVPRRIRVPSVERAASTVSLGL